MFGPRQLRHVVEYLDGVDRSLSSKLARKQPPDEPSLTNELCALLDADTQRDENTLSYDLDHLNRDLAVGGDGTDFEITLDTHPHNPAMEHFVSQADFGLILRYDNRVLPSASWHTAYLIQAKRLFRHPASSEYDLHSRFRAADSAQQERLERLADILGSERLLYGLYCPPVKKLERSTTATVRALHNLALADEIFDYSIGLALRDNLTRHGGIDAGFWFRGIDEKPTGLRNLHKGAFRSALPFTWFILEHFASSQIGGIAGGLRRRPSILTSFESVDRTMAIVTGDRSAIRDLIDELAVGGDAPKHIAVLPRHTITISVTVTGASPDVD